MIIKYTEKKVRIHFKTAVMAAVVCGISTARAEPAATPASFVTDEFLRSGALSLIRAEYAYARGYTGKEVTIAIVDSGLDVTHPEFANRISAFRRNFAPHSKQDPTVDPDRLTDLELDGKIDGHGTHVAGLAAAARDGQGMHGVAFDAVVLPLRTDFDDEQLKEVYNQAILGGAKVLNGSYGPSARPELYLTDDDGEYYLNPNYQRVDIFPVAASDLQDSYKIARQAIDADIVLIYSAGNEYQSQPVASRIPNGSGMLPLITPENTRDGLLYRFLQETDDVDVDPNNPNTWTYFGPGELPDDVVSMDFSDIKGALIAVAATDKEGRIASYSNRCGAAATWCLAAPGGDYATTGALWSTYPYSTYKLMQGTSMAAPVTTGAAAVLREAFPYMTARQIIQVMLTTTNSTGLWADSSIYGRGLLDLGKAINGPGEFGGEGFAPIFSVDTQGYNSVWRNDISGSGGMAKNGAGTLTLTGQNSYTGATTVAGGMLVVDGSIASSPLTVEIAGRLGGSGEVGPTEMYGRVAPGNSVGTLTVAGDYTQHPGSVFELELDNAAASDLLHVTGRADILGGSLELGGLQTQHVNQSFTFLQADGGVTGSLDASRFNRLFVDLDTVASGQDLSLRVQRNARSFASLGNTPNQRSVAAAMDGQGVGHAAHDAAVLLNDAGSAARLYDSLSGELYASTGSGLLDVGQTLGTSVLGRTRASLRANGDAAPAWTSGQSEQTLSAGRHVLWGEVLGRWGRLDGGSKQAYALDRDLGGFLLGGDTALTDYSRAGVSLGYTNSSFKNGFGRSKVDGYHVLAYLGTQLGAWGLRGGIGQSWYTADTRRDTGLESAGVARSRANTHATQVFAEAGYGVESGRLRWEPYAGVAQAWLRQGGFSESGNAAGLRGDTQRSSVTYTTLGLRSSLRLERGEAEPIQIELGLGWRHAFGDVASSRDLRFLSGGPSYTISGTPLAKDALVAELGLYAALGERGRVGLRYTGQMASSNTHDHGLQINVDWAF